MENHRTRTQGYGISNLEMNSSTPIITNILTPHKSNEHVMASVSHSIKPIDADPKAFCVSARSVHQLPKLNLRMVSKNGPLGAINPIIQASANLSSPSHQLTMAPLITVKKINVG